MVRIAPPQTRFSTSARIRERQSGRLGRIAAASAAFLDEGGVGNPGQIDRDVQEGAHRRRFQKKGC